MATEPEMGAEFPWDVTKKTSSSLKWIPRKLQKVMAMKDEENKCAEKTRMWKRDWLRKRWGGQESNGRTQR